MKCKNMASEKRRREVKKYIEGDDAYFPIFNVIKVH
jgi:hypothetical protein